jgi:mannosyltransferase OCH1-like enzyme
VGIWIVFVFGFVVIWRSTARFYDKYGRIKLPDVIRPPWKVRGAGDKKQHSYFQPSRAFENEAKFPLIIHQTWKSYHVPEDFSTWVQSWHKYNPLWEYWFWSQAETDALISTKFPQFKEIFANYDQDIRRADTIR